MRHLPTFASQTKGALRADTIHGAAMAFVGALVVGLAFGTLGAAGVCVALMGIMLAVAGLGLMFCPRPMDPSLYRAAVALPMGFACPVVRVDAKSAPLRVGAPTATARRAWKAYLAAAAHKPAAPWLTAKAEAKAASALDALNMARARWLNDWHKTA